MTRRLSTAFTAIAPDAFINTFGGAALSAEMIMKYTIKVYSNSTDHGAYLKARFDKSITGQSFEWAGHRWAYEVTSFDDAGDYDLLYRFDDKPYPEEISVTADDMTIRDYFAAKALGLCFAQYLNHAEVEGFQDGWRDGVAADSYQMADAMLRAREAS